MGRVETADITNDIKKVVRFLTYVDFVFCIGELIWCNPE